MGARKVTFNVAEAKAQFSSIVRRVMAGEEIVIARDNHPLVKITSLSAPSQPRKPGSAKGRAKMAVDFDRTPSDFDGYV